MTFAEVVKAARERDGFKIGVRGMAKRLGVSSATLSRVECGREPDIGNFFKICAGLSLDPRDFAAEFTDVGVPADGKVAP